MLFNVTFTAFVTLAENGLYRLINDLCTINGMADIFSRKKRIRVMSLIRYKWTKPEKKVHNFLMGHKIPHKMHPEGAPGADILLFDSNIAVLLHGCFWHGCQTHFRAPKSNITFWKNKLEKNLKRDSKVRALLKKLGFKVVVIWEHSLNKNFEGSMRRLVKA